MRTVGKTGPVGRFGDVMGFKELQGFYEFIPELVSSVVQSGMFLKQVLEPCGR